MRVGRMSNVYADSKLAFHKKKLEDLTKGKISAPIYVRVKPTNVCNHKCFYCGYEEDIRRNNMDRISSIPFEKMMEILSDFKDMGVKAVTYSGGGEPLVYPHIVETMKRTLENNIDLSIITNGQKLEGENAELLTKAKWVRISSSESDAKTFAETRKRPESWFDELIGNIKNFARAKKSDCEFGINFVVSQKNVSNVYDSIAFFRDLGVNHVKITPVWMENFLEYHAKIRGGVEEQIQRARDNFSGETFQIYDTYEKDFEHSGLNKRLYGKCYHMQIVPVIAADSKVYFCHDKAYKPNGELGSIEETSFRELWFSDKAKGIFDNFDPRVGCKHHCANDQRNLLTKQMLNNLEQLEKYFPKSEKHKNFI
jgi:sulfatase maturation enzyme AslB (radical SAM superfamily)